MHPIWDIVYTATVLRRGMETCNDTLYLLLRHYVNTDIKVDFIHVPYLPEQGSPSLPLEDTVRAILAAIAAC